jgi:hypothetical protein
MVQYFHAIESEKNNSSLQTENAVFMGFLTTMKGNTEDTGWRERSDSLEYLILPSYRKSIVRDY